MILHVSNPVAGAPAFSMQDSTAPLVANAQHEPHEPWFVIGVT